MNQFEGLTNVQGQPLGADFITYWAASLLAQQGDPSGAYDSIKLLAAEQSIAAVKMAHTAWYYPPQFLLLAWPLAWLPYAVAYLTFCISSLALYFFAIRTICPHRFAIALFAFPTVFLCLISGQNGLITASLAALSLYYLASRPILAGCILSLLCIKPQLLLLFPIALVLTKQWRALLAFMTTSALFSALPTIIFGWSIWPVFLDGLNAAKHYLETDIPLERMPTIFSVIRQAGGSLSTAYAGHTVIACIAAVTALTIWRRNTVFEIRASALIAATLLISPYLFDYDLVWYALPIAWLYQHGNRHGWLPGERVVLLFAWAVALYIKLLIHLIFGKIVLVAAPISMALLWLTWRRAQLPQPGAPELA